MEILYIGIKTEDPEYGRVLQEVLARNYRGFVVSLRVGVPEEMEGEEYADLWLADREELAGPGDVLLTENPGSEQLDPAKGPCRIFRYAPAAALIGKILKICSAKRGYAIYYAGEGAGKILTAISASGGRGVTSMTLSLAREYARGGGRKVLYLTLEQFPSQEIYAPVSRPAVAVRELLYCGYERQFSGEAGDLLEQSLWQEEYGVDLLWYEPGENPLCTLDRETMAKFLLWLGSSRFDGVFIDGGDRLTPALEAASEAADQILFLTGEELRDRNFLKLLKRRGGSGLEQKTLLVYDRYAPPVGSQEPVSKTRLLDKLWTEEEGTLADLPTGDIFLTEDPESFIRGENSIQISLAGTYGAEISKIIAKLGW